MTAASRARGALENLREEVLARRARLDHEIELLRKDRGSSNTDDEHDPEGTPLSGEWSRLEGLRADAADELADVDAALKRLDAGDHGTCVTCGRVIPAERLIARPTASQCVECAEKSAR